ncbi:signal transduction histidine kinase [Oleiphilus messinensis]|uniref:histidine kinase n=1 Tax=Oleiphilus messinensis TaxID=141451 RepID=A0A1Y0I4T5_9GAMM|nr:ATP-binding protein [Oleiphilus messinensis]ARU54464.1 signal transduction histidine kinase [Oleiphilus messinensis]
MRLKYQLILISLVTLILPWSAYQFIHQLEAELRFKQQSMLQHNATITARFLAQTTIFDGTAQGKDGASVYAFALPQPVFLDGYFDDWLALGVDTREIKSDFLPTNDTFQVSYLLGFYQDRLYAYINVTDPDIHRHNPNPGQHNSTTDNIQFEYRDHNGVHRRGTLFATSPGLINSTTQGQDIPVEVDAYWQYSETGYTVEISIPFADAKGGFGFTVINPENAPPDPFIPPRSLGNILPLPASVAPTFSNPHSSSPEFNGYYDDPRTMEPDLLPTPLKPQADRDVPTLRFSDPEINRYLAEFSTAGIKMTVIDQQGWIIGKSGELESQHSFPIITASSSFFKDIVGTLIRWTLFEKPPRSQQQPSADRDQSDLAQQALKGSPTITWQAQGSRNYALISSVVPLFQNQKIVGALRLDQNTDAIASISNETIFDMVAIAAASIFIIMIMLLGFASLLSWRIQKLSKQIDACFSTDGVPQNSLIPGTGQDEISDLRRRFAALLDANMAYTAYLQSFAQKLSHEIKTPVAIIRSSLDNASLHNNIPTELNEYIERGQSGVKRISGIIDSMRAATRLEKLIQTADNVEFDLYPVVAEYSAAFQLAAPKLKVMFEAAELTYPVQGNPDLIAQLLDKLLDNAKDFTPEGKSIRLRLFQKHQTIILEVENEGPALPERMQQQIFQPFISIRSNEQQHRNDSHMGLGLVIVKLITDFHRGRIEAQNLTGNTGVRFTLILPAGPTP